MSCPKSRLAWKEIILYYTPNGFKDNTEKKKARRSHYHTYPFLFVNPISLAQLYWLLLNARTISRSDSSSATDCAEVLPRLVNPEYRTRYAYQLKQVPKAKCLCLEDALQER